VRRLDRRLAGPDLRHDREALGLGDHGHDSLPEQRLVVDDQHRHRRAHPGVPSRVRSKKVMTRSSYSCGRAATCRATSAVSVQEVSGLRHHGVRLSGVR